MLGRIFLLLLLLLGGVGVVVAKHTGLMNMLEAQNTLVLILNPTVLTWVVTTHWVPWVQNHC